MPKIDLVSVGTQPVSFDWNHGQIHNPQTGMGSLLSLIKHELTGTQSDFCLFWDSRLGVPDATAVINCLSLPGDAWHAGLKLGMGGKPGLLDFVQPTWMLNCDAPLDIISTSWRLSLRACLVKTDVLRQLGAPNPGFDTLTGAGLDWGLRLLKAGIFLRHVPSLLQGNPGVNSADLTLADEMRIIRNWSGSFWVKWAATNAVVTRYCSLSAGIHAWKEQSKYNPNPPVNWYQRESVQTLSQKHPPTISIIIPTLHRYTYLRVLLDQLRRQTISPLEIIVVDQTPIDERDLEIITDFSDLPLRWIFQDLPGQCTARNTAIKTSKGDLLLFLDDDVELPSQTTGLLLKSMSVLQADVCAGTVHEPGEQDLSSATMNCSVSSVFPLGNILLQKSILGKSGLFDLAYDHGARADGDLGMRVYLSGALVAQDLSIDLLHHHAPRGGLRVHGARKVTARQSRQALFHRNIPSVTEFYLARRYFTPKQVRNYRLIMLFASMRSRGHGLRRLVKGILNSFLLPVTYIQLLQQDGQAKKLFSRFPQVPGLDSPA